MRWGRVERPLFKDIRLSGDRFGQFAAEKIANRRGNFLSVFFRSKMPGVEEMNFSGRGIALECFRARRQEEWIVLSPDSEQ